MPRYYHMIDGDVQTDEQYETHADAIEDQRQKVKEYSRQGDTETAASIRPIAEWYVSEDYGNGTRYWRNPELDVEVFIEDTDTGYHAGIFDSDGYTIDGSRLEDVPETRAIAHVFSLIQHIEEYVSES